MSLTSSTGNTRPTKSRELRRLVGAISSALLMIAAFPGNAFALLVWVCMIPWLLTLPGAGWRSRTLSSLVFSGLVWMVYLWRPFFDAASSITASQSSAAFLTALHLLSCMVPFVVLGVLHHRLDGDSVFSAIGLASVLVASTFLTPGLFTFNFGTLLYEHPVPLQLVDISGTSLLLWTIALCNLLLRNLIINAWHQCGSMRSNLVALVTVMVLVYGYGAIQLNDGPGGARSASTENGSLRIASIQPNMGPSLSARSIIRDSKHAARSHIELTRQALRENSALDLVVWPENGLFVDCSDPFISERISALAQDIRVPIMHQCFDCTQAEENGDCFNQSRYVNANGESLSRHNKTNLVPLFEQLPSLSLGPAIKDELSNRTFYREGTGASVFEHPKAQIIPAICFDAHSVKLVRDGLEMGGQVLVVQSNDRIFKGSKIGLYDLAINVVQAVALRVPMAKINNSGYGGFVQADGHIVPGSITPPDTVQATVQELDLVQRNSLYRRFGNWFAPVAGALALFQLLGRGSPMGSVIRGPQATGRLDCQAAAQIPANEQTPAHESGTSDATRDDSQAQSSDMPSSVSQRAIQETSSDASPHKQEPGARLQDGANPS